jgi:hypothetical protein
MKSIDNVTQKSRGFFIIRPSEGGSQARFCRVTAGQSHWSEVVANLFQSLVGALKCSTPSSQLEIVETLLHGIRKEFGSSFSSLLVDLHGNISAEHRSDLNQLFEEIHALPLYRIIKQIMTNEEWQTLKSQQCFVDEDRTEELAAVILLAVPTTILQQSQASCCQSNCNVKTFEDLITIPEQYTTLQHEVQCLRDTLTALVTFSNSMRCACCSN